VGLTDQKLDDQWDQQDRIRKAIAMGDTTGHRVDPNSSTWRAIKEFIRSKGREEYIPSLRNKQLEYPEVQYARGAMDALDSLLEFGGEEV